MSKMENIINAITENFIPLILAIIGSSIISTLITVVAQRKLREADIRDKETAAAERIVNIYDKTVERLEDRIRCIYEDLGKLKKENETLRKRLDELELQYAERISMLKHRLGLLERLFAKIYQRANGKLRELAGSIPLTEEDICYLKEIIDKEEE